jgi:hypothetical protein
MSFATSLLSLLLVISISLAALPAQAGGVELDVSVKSVGSAKKGRSHTSNRILIVRVDNRGDEDHRGLRLEWKVSGRDVKTRRSRIVATGSESVNVPAGEEVEVETKRFSFTTTDGKVERIWNKNKNGPKYRIKVHPDTGTRYHGYSVVLKRGGKIIAEASTPGVR